MRQVAFALLAFCGACGTTFEATRAAPPEPAAAAPSAPAGPRTRPPENLIVLEGSVTVLVDDVPATAAAVRDEVAREQGKIVQDEVQGSAGESWRGLLKVRLPPGRVEPFLDWLAHRGEIESRRLKATDVSREFFDQELAIRNLEATRARLEELYARPGLKMQEVLEIEKELDRVRGEIERIKGAARFLRDQAALATLDLVLSPRGEAAPAFAPRAKLHLGPRLSLFTLFDPGARAETRIGGGGQILLDRAFSFELEAFPAEAGRGVSILTSIGGAAYSDFLGGGRRRLLNPFFGYRVGYAYLDGQSAFLAAGELGVELLKTRYVEVDAQARLVGLFSGEGSDGAFEGGVGLAVPF